MQRDRSANAPLRKLRPAKARNAVRRRWFEYRLSRIPLRDTPNLVSLGTAYGGWIMPAGLIEPSWTCYSVGAGGDISFDLELIERYGLTVRAFDAVAGYVEEAAAQAAGEPRFSVRQAAITIADGPVQMQVTHDPQSRSVSPAHLYESSKSIELPGRSLRSLMDELGDDRIELLKLDIEGGEYQLLSAVDLRALGVKIFATQLHHTGSVREARALVARLHEQGYDAVACRPAVKITFAARELLL
jgi:FkbM family methyltransferase